MGDGTALVVVDGGMVDRVEMAYAVQRRWAGATVMELANAEPSVAFTVGDAVELATVRRGVEPLRMLVRPQRDQPVVQPLPVVL